MKRMICLLLIMIFSLTSCISNNTPDDSNENEDDNLTNPQDEIYYENPFSPIEEGLASIELNKQVYELNDEIVINIHNADKNDYVAIYDLDKEPGNGLPYEKTKVSDKTVITYSLTELNLEPKEYAVCLYQNKTMWLFDRVVFRVSDGDTNDYQILSASFNANNSNNVRTSSLTINPSTQKYLTYSIYWAKDGNRLSDYTALEKVVKGDVESFTIDFNENMIMPKEANEIEIAILEGNSSSYFIRVDDTLKLEQSKYLYNFQILTDIHANTDITRYGFWNSHLYNALLDIKCLSGNTSGIFTVGDNTDMGSSTHYDLLFSTIEDVFGNDIPNFYYTMGNHDYMYFSSDVGGFNKAVDYFVERTEMKNNYYSFDFNGNKVIMLSSEIQTTGGAIYEDQMKWFKNEVSSAKEDEFIFIYLHQPLYNTVAGTLPGENNHGIDNVGTEITEFLKDYPNAILFTGHTHYSMNGKNTAVFGNGKNANYVNNGAVAYLWSDIDNVGEVGGQCNFVEVYEDYIIIKARDILAKEWISSAQFVIYLY